MRLVLSLSLLQLKKKGEKRKKRRRRRRRRKKKREDKRRKRFVGEMDKFIGSNIGNKISKSPFFL